MLCARHPYKDVALQRLYNSAELNIYTLGNLGR